MESRRVAINPGGALQPDIAIDNKMNGFHGFPDVL